MSVDSHVNPSPRVCHSIPRWSASFRSPACHFSLFTNWTTHTDHWRAHARPITPNAAELLPLPVPVLTSSRDGCGIVSPPYESRTVPVRRDVGHGALRDARLWRCRERPPSCDPIG